MLIIMYCEPERKKRNNHFVRKQYQHVKLLMLTRARRNRGTAGCSPPQIFAKVALLPIEKDSEKEKVANIYIYKYFKVLRKGPNCYSPYLYPP